MWYLKCKLTHIIYNILIYENDTFHMIIGLICHCVYATVDNHRRKGLNSEFILDIRSMWGKEWESIIIHSFHCKVVFSFDVICRKNVAFRDVFHVLKVSWQMWKWFLFMVVACFSRVLLLLPFYNLCGKKGVRGFVKTHYHPFKIFLWQCF